VSKSNFEFLKSEYPTIASLGELAEASLYTDPSNTLAKLRIISERITLFLLQYEGCSDYDSKDQFTRLKILQDEECLPSTISETLHSIRKSGNKAAHNGEGNEAEARFMLRKMFQLCCWFYSLYETPVTNVDYVLPVNAISQDNERIALLEAQLKSKDTEIAARESKIKELSALSVEQKQAQKEVGKKILRKLDETEAETRDRIDKQLRDTGWDCDSHTLNYKSNKSLPEKGAYKAIAEWPCGKGWADYALFIGLELVGIIEAKKHSKNVQSDLEQSRRYSKEIELKTDFTFHIHNNCFVYKVPFLFATNGRKFLEQHKTASGIWFWDARKQTNLERPLSDWLSPKDIKEKLAFSEDAGEDKLRDTAYDILTDPIGLNLRYYQIEAIKALENKILNHPEDPRALIAMDWYR
jgi:type I restriction enzyme R subunit